jgi:hypothetical protein
VVRVANPGECTRDRDSHTHVGDHAHDKDCVVVVLVIDENGHELEHQPHATGASIDDISLGWQRHRPPEVRT